MTHIHIKMVLNSSTNGVYTNGHSATNAMNGTSTNGVHYGIPENVYGMMKGNNAHKGWVIQKFGGTSVGKFPRKIATDIVKYILPHPPPSTIRGLIML